MANIYSDIVKVFDGGPTSGNYGHAGRPGKVGGSQEDPSASKAAGKIQKTAKTSKTNFKKFIDEEVFKNPKQHSLGKYLDKNGNIKPERRKLYANIISEMLTGVHQTNHPVIYFTGGGTASGKSTALKSIVPEAPSADNKRGIVIDPDEIKKFIPEYEEMIKKGDPSAAAYAHEESSMLAKLIQNAVFSTGRYSSLIDGTLGGNLESTRRKIQNAKKTGNPVVGNFVTTNYDEALKRAYQRYLKTGRFPNVDATLKIHQGVSNNFPELYKEFDGGKLIDTTSRKPKTIAEFKDGKLKIKDKKLYQEFIEKQKLTKSDINRYKNNLKKNFDRYAQEWWNSPDGKQWQKENPGKTLRKPPKI